LGWAEHVAWAEEVSIWKIQPLGNLRQEWDNNIKINFWEEVITFTEINCSQSPFHRYWKFVYSPSQRIVSFEQSSAFETQVFGNPP
jgi:hypothetical protein